jgi:hypothetical protein
MRKAISLMMVLVLGMAVMGTSAYAVCPDPDHITPWRYNGDPTPAGDDSAWDDAQTSPPGSALVVRRVIITGNWLISSLFGDLLYDIVVDWTLEPESDGTRNDIEIRRDSAANTR